MNIHSTPRHAESTGAGAAAHQLKHREDVASYVAAMLAELRQIASKAGFDKLVKTLDAAYYDAYGALDSKGRETAGPPVAPPQEKTLPREEPNPVEPH